MWLTWRNRSNRRAATRTKSGRATRSLTRRSSRRAGRAGASMAMRKSPIQRDRDRASSGVGETPILLLPVRLETTFFPPRLRATRPWRRAASDQLWVAPSIPTECAVDTFEAAAVGKPRVASGQTFTGSRTWAAGRSGRRRSGRGGVWRKPGRPATGGRPRAAWIAHGVCAGPAPSPPRGRRPGYSC